MKKPSKSGPILTLGEFAVQICPRLSPLVQIRHRFSPLVQIRHRSFPCRRWCLRRLLRAAMEVCYSYHRRGHRRRFLHSPPSPCNGSGRPPLVAAIYGSSEGKRGLSELSQVNRFNSQETKARPRAWNRIGRMAQCAM